MLGMWWLNNSKYKDADVKPDTKFESFEDDILKGLHEILEYLNYYSNKGLRFAIDNHDSKVERINLAINYS